MNLSIWRILNVSSLTVLPPVSFNSVRLFDLNALKGHFDTPGAQTVSRSTNQSVV